MQVRSSAEVRPLADPVAAGPASEALGPVAPKYAGKEVSNPLGTIIAAGALARRETSSLTFEIQ